MVDGYCRCSWYSPRLRSASRPEHRQYRGQEQRRVLDDSVELYDSHNNVLSSLLNEVSHNQMSHQRDTLERLSYNCDYFGGKI